MNLNDYVKTTTQAEFAALLNVTQGCVWQWLNGVINVTAERAIQIEKATNGKISRAELRPDIFGEKLAVVRSTRDRRDRRKQVCET